MTPPLASIHNKIPSFNAYWQFSDSVWLTFPLIGPTRERLSGFLHAATTAKGRAENPCTVVGDGTHE